MRAAVVCDNWKLPLFKQILGNAGYAWEEKPFTKDTTSLFIEFDDREALHMVVRNCEAAAKRQKAATKKSARKKKKDRD